MKTKDILVGVKYSHTAFPKTVYLGVGREKFKGLVIVSDPEHKMTGLLVMGPRYLKSINPKFWDGFYVDNS